MLTGHFTGSLTGRTSGAPSFDNPTFLGQKSCRTKVPRIFRIFVPDFAPNFAPNFSRIFRASFQGKQRPEKIHQNPRHFSMQNSQANMRKKKGKIHKMFLESRQSKDSGVGGGGQNLILNHCHSEFLLTLKRSPPCPFGYQADGAEKTKGDN